MKNKRNVKNYCVTSKKGADFIRVKNKKTPQILWITIKTMFLSKSYKMYLVVFVYFIMIYLKCLDFILNFKKE